MYKTLQSIFLTVIILSNSGCASIVSKSHYPVTITSSPDGATITITDKNNRQIYRGTTPATVTLRSSTGYFSGATYAVTFEKAGYETQTVYIEKQLDAWYIGNILIGGLIGLLIVDPATGCMWKLPSDVNATLAKRTLGFSIDGKELRIAFFDDVPSHLRPQMIKLK